MLLMLTIITADRLTTLQSAQATAIDKEAAARALLEIKSSAVSTIMLDPSVNETKVVFDDAEKNILRLSNEIAGLHLSAKFQAQFRHVIQLWQTYDAISESLIYNTNRNGMAPKAALLQFYHQSFKPFENSIKDLSASISEDADKSRAAAQQNARFVYWILFPLMLLNCLGIIGLTISLQRNGERTRVIVNTVIDAIIEINEKGNIQSINPAAEEMFGYSWNEVIGKNVSLLMPEPHQSRHNAYIQRYLDTGESKAIGVPRETLAVKKNGRIFPIEIALVEAKYGKKRTFFASIKDISRRKSIEQEQRIAAIAFETQEGIIITDAEKNIVRVNHAFSEITGYSSKEVVGKNPSLLKSGKHDKPFYDQMKTTLDFEGTWKGEIWNRKKNGDLYPQWLSITVVKDKFGSITNYVGTIADISEHKKAEEIMRNLAFYDPLTQLANRRQILHRTEKALAASKRNGLYGALIYLDMDKFKVLNDTKGHEFGDMLLCEVANRLRNCTRTEDTVARLGGDEFAILVENLDASQENASEMAQNIGNKIVRALGKAYFLNGHEHHSSSSVGVALFRGDQVQLDELYRQADAAMYAAKRAGRNTLRFGNSVSD
jgi:diguanylate cyclase (GGDEF)-like protein/PAS domain S-box-containing protein